MQLYSLTKAVLIILVYSVKTLKNILKGKIIDNYNQENNKINDFEYIWISIKLSDSLHIYTDTSLGRSFYFHKSQIQKYASDS